MNLSNLNLEDVTIVILSHKRQHCLRVVLDFYSNFNIKLLVIDNSAAPLESSIIPKKCTYVHSETSYRERAAIAANFIETKYAIMAADDEIYIPAALLNMKKFLDNNDEYVAVGAQTIAVWKYGKITASAWAYAQMYKYENIKSRAIDRVKFHTGNGKNPYTSFFTCNLTRTEVLKKCLESYSISPVLATDALSVLTICGGGKSLYLNELYWVRNWNQSPRSHKNWNRSLSISKWWELNKGKEIQLVFKKDLYNIVKYSFNKKDFETAIDLILSSDLHYLRPRFKLRQYYKYLIESDNFKSAMFRLKFFANKEKIPNGIDVTLSEMSTRGISVNNAQVLLAAKLVSNLKPYKNW